MTLVAFTPSDTTVFAFQAQLQGGGTYIISVPYNVVGERYYVSVSDLSGNVIAYRALVETGPSFPATLTWADNVATAALTSPHNVPVGGLANMRISQTGTGFDGLYQGLAVDLETFTFPLTTNPQQSQPVTGKLDFPFDLLGYLPGNIGPLYWHSDVMQFEY
jgi:hypothetical protein